MELNMVARHVIKTLRRARRLGHVIIVTNAEKGWVELTCAKFLPEVFPHLEGIKVISARSAFEHVQPPSPVQWKWLTFHQEIAAFYQMQERLPGMEHKSSIIPSDGGPRLLDKVTKAHGKAYCRAAFEAA